MLLKMMKPYLAAGASSFSYNHKHLLHMHPQTDELCHQVFFNGMVPLQSLC